MLSRVFTTKEQFLMLGCAIAIALGSATLYAMRPVPPVAAVNVREVEIPQPPHLQQPAEAVVKAIDMPAVLPAFPSIQTISVSVSGAVATPGVYEFQEHDRVDRAIEMAGGASAAADLTDINKAAELIDGSSLVIPVAAVAGIEDGKRMVIRNGQTAASLNPPEYTISGWMYVNKSMASEKPSADPPPANAPAKSNGLIDLNTASSEELEKLPGVGPKLADAIIQYRQRQAFQTVNELDNVPGFGEKRVADIRPHVTVSPQ